MKITIKFEREDIENLCKITAARLLKRETSDVEATYGASYEKSCTVTYTEGTAPDPAPAEIAPPAPAENQAQEEEPF